MKSLPEIFDKHLRKAIGVRAVWLPGSPVEIGDILVKGDELFQQVGHIRDFGATLTSEPQSAINLDLASTKVKQRIFQANAEIGKAQLDLSAEAQVRFEFQDKAQFVLKTPALSGESIDNLLAVAAAVTGKPGWDHDRFFIVSKALGATDWTFLGATQSGSSFDVSGKGSGILSFLTAGLSAGLQTSGTNDVKLTGKSGIIGMDLVRISEKGNIKPVD